MNAVLPIATGEPSGRSEKVPTIGTVLLMIANCSPLAGVKPSEAVRALPPRSTWPFTSSWL